jgi:hypothetical protein
VPKTHGYQLPPGDAFTDELECALVFFPDKPEYRRALLGALTYFETWLAWELDDSKRGKDAARAWALANFCTLECWNMACIDELLETMEAVRALLENKKDCCDDNTTYGIQEEIETDITPGVGDPPDYYGETAIATWDDWDEHVCYNAHLYVDNLKNIGNQIGGAFEQNSLFLGLIAAGLVLLTFSGVGLPVAYLLASFVVTGLVLTATATTFADTADEIEEARNDIICAILQGGSLATIVENAIGSAAWTLFYQYVDYDSAMSIIHDGGITGDYLPTETRDDCYCGPELEDGQLVKNPSWVNNADYWDLVDWTWGAGTGDHLGTLGGTPDATEQTDYADFQSDNFTIPAGVTAVMPQVRALARLNKPTPTFFVRLHDASDDSVIDWDARAWSENDGIWYTKDFDDMDVDAGTVCYIQVKVGGAENYAQYIDWAKIWEA